ncbi:hypothetical protein ACIQSP_13285 [Streptomyces nigra]|uniref:hypothetical protein n=1 Tax=Streptomyces nigra TaxID=1827580 RepID=UPI003801A779
MALVDPVGAPVEAATPLLLAVSNYEVFELPENAAPWPSLGYTLRGQVAEWDGPGTRMELRVDGPLKVSWSRVAYTLGCEVSPDFKALDEAVASGSARAIGGVALDQLCSRLRTESRDAIGSLFAAVSVSTGLGGTPRIGCPIGDETTFLRVEFEPVERTVIYTGARLQLPSRRARRRSPAASRSSYASEPTNRTTSPACQRPSRSWRSAPCSSPPRRRGPAAPSSRA